MLDNIKKAVHKLSTLGSIYCRNRKVYDNIQLQSRQTTVLNFLLVFLAEITGFLVSFRSSIVHTFSIGFESGDLAGH